MLQPFIIIPPPPALSRFISSRLFSVPQVENEVKRTLLWGCCWGLWSRNWWIKEGPKTGIFAGVSEIVLRRKSLYICQWSLFRIKKKVCVFLTCLRFKKKSPKLLDRTVYMVCACVYVFILCSEPAGRLSVNLKRTFCHSRPLPSHGFNFVTSATATYSMRVLVERERHYRHILHSSDTILCNKSLDNLERLLGDLCVQCTITKQDHKIYL